MEQAIVDRKQGFLWGSIEDENLQAAWNQLAYPYSPQYHTTCLSKSRLGNGLHILLFFENQEAVAGGIFTRKTITKGGLTLHYLEFGIPMAIQCPFLAKNSLNFQHSIGWSAALEEALSTLCKAFTARFVLWKGVREGHPLGQMLKERWISLEASPFWYWHHQGSLETYIEQFHRHRRKGCRRLLRKFQEQGFTWQVTPIEALDDRQLTEITEVFRLNCRKYGYDTGWDSLAYFKALQQVAGNRAQVLQLKDQDSLLSFELVTYTTHQPRVYEVSLTGTRELRIPSLSLYDMLFLAEVNWVTEQGKAFESCQIGQGCDQAKASMGAQTEPALTLVWIPSRFLRSLGRWAVDILRALPESIKKRLYGLLG